MFGLLINAWAIAAAAFKSMIGANTENRNDFNAIANVLQAAMTRLEGQVATEIDRRERMQVKLDEMYGTVEQLRQENTDLRRQRAEDESTIRRLTDRVAFLESREAAHKAKDSA